MTRPLTKWPVPALVSGEGARLLLHTNISMSELRGGGKKSAGTDRVIAQDHQHYSPEELAARMVDLVQEGYTLTISVLAYKDKRKPVVSEREQFRVPRCDRHNCPAYAAAMEREGAHE